MDTKLLKSSLLAGPIGLAAALISLIVFSLIATRCDDPDAVVSLLAICALIIGAAVSGFSSSLMYKKKSAAPSLISGFVYLILVLAVSLIFRGKGSDQRSFIMFGVRALSCLAVSFLCGFAANPASAKTRRSRSRYRGYKRGRT